jgi:hypothetical protein
VLSGVSALRPEPLLRFVVLDRIIATKILGETQQNVRALFTLTGEEHSGVIGIERRCVDYFFFADALDSGSEYSPSNWDSKGPSDGPDVL